MTPFLRTIGLALAALAFTACRDGTSTSSSTAPAARAELPPLRAGSGASVDASAPADRVAARRVVTFYRWSSTEPGDERTRGESIEHGTPKLHLVFEAHRGPDDRGWITVAALPGSVSVPENTRMRPLIPPSSDWHVPRDGYTEYSLEQFGGEVRSDEPIQVFLASAPEERQTLVPSAEPTFLRLPRANTLPATSRAATGQYDAIVIVLVPVTNRRGGRYLIYALDMVAQPAGFAANGVMTRAPSVQEIGRYAAWMRDPNGMNRDRNPPISVHPIDR